jgi:hypothetical protein
MYLCISSRTLDNYIKELCGIKFADGLGVKDIKAYDL